MSQEQKTDKKPKTDNAPKAGPMAAEQTHCKSEGCKKKHEKFGFCMEHYDWYMAGIIRGDGQKPIDFEQKYGQYVAKRAKKAA